MVLDITGKFWGEGACRPETLESYQGSGWVAMVDIDMGLR
jgi:hypothetical protein